MKLKDVVVFTVSLAFHCVAVVLLISGEDRDVQISLSQGKSTVKLTLAPSHWSQPKLKLPVEVFETSSTQKKISGLPILPRKVEAEKIINESKEFVKKKITPLEKKKPKTTIKSQALVENEKKKDADLKVKGVTSAIITVSAIKGIYPESARRKNQEGIVRVRVEVLASGVVGQVKIVQSSRFWRLNQAAVETIKKAKFLPALKNGKAIKSSKEFEIDFKLDN